MRSFHRLVIGLGLLCFLQAAAAGPNRFIARQDNTASPEVSQEPTPSRVESIRESSSVIESKEPASETRTAERQTEWPSRTTTRPTIEVTTSTLATSTAALSNDASSSSTAAAAATNPLPIHPKLTPAMGIAGVVLLVSGIVYTVIGIRMQWLYVSFSAAYLTSLSVTVLIVYLMSLPVSDAVQGGFFVAAVLTGLLFGGLSVIFADLTDGLGCMLGGFCLSMWFLTLKEGGLIEPAWGRAVFIGCMSAAGYALSFIHYTRTYALIGSISFAGSTITMLGVDCFSRAGWKEFWLYIWHLSPDAFPLHTTTYPLTRAIKAEVAGVVMLTVFGVISQIKLWRVVRERRERNAVDRLERNQDLQREDEEVGRRINDSLSRERARWEAVYGNGAQQQDSAIDSSSKDSAKTSMTIREKDGYLSDSVEMATLPQKQAGLRPHRLSTASKRASTQPSVTVTAVQEEDEIERIDAEGKPVYSTNKRSSSQGDPFDTRANSTRDSSDMAISGETRSSIRSAVSPPPAIVPLPFKIPSEEDARSQEGDNTSVSVMVESTHESMPQKSPTKRASGNSLLKRISMARSESDEEALIIPYIEDDRASSLAATLDEEFDRISMPESPLGSTFDEKTNEADASYAPLSLSDDITKNHPEFGAAVASRRSSRGTPDQSASSPLTPTFGDTAKASSSEGHSSRRQSGGSSQGSPDYLPKTILPQSLTSSTDPAPKSAGLEHGHNITTVDEVDEDAESEGTARASRMARLSKEALPHKLSKVALSYRTNEWAKHLELAEEPEVEALPEPGSPGVKIAHGPEERPAPLTDEIKGIQPPEKVPSRRTSTGNNPYQTSSLMRSTSSMSRQSLQASPAVHLKATFAQRAGSRSSSSPLLSQTLEMAAPDRVFNTPSPRLSSSPSPIPSNTLLGQREQLTRKKISSPTLTPLSSSPNLLSALDQDNMTLAQRKALIAQQRPPSASQQWRQSTQNLGPQIQSFDSHQPRRSSGAPIDASKREVMLAGWRESVGNVGTPSTTPVIDTEQMRRAALMNEKRAKEIAMQERALKAQKRESAMGNMMRSGEMLDAHREAMRRMQAKANRNV